MSSPAETIVLYLLVDCFCNTTLYKIFLETRFLMVSIFHNFHVAVGFHVVFLFDRCFGQLGPSQLPRWLGFRRIWTWVFQCPSQSLRAFQESLGLLPPGNCEGLRVFTEIAADPQNNGFGTCNGSKGRAFDRFLATSIFYPYETHSLRIHEHP